MLQCVDLQYKNTEMAPILLETQAFETVIDFFIGQFAEQESDHKVLLKMSRLLLDCCFQIIVFVFYLFDAAFDQFEFILVRLFA